VLVTCCKRTAPSGSNTTTATCCLSYIDCRQYVHTASSREVTGGMPNTKCMPPPVCRKQNFQSLSPCKPHTRQAHAHGTHTYMQAATSYLAPARLCDGRWHHGAMHCLHTGKPQAWQQDLHQPVCMYMLLLQQHTLSHV
jgi:hypothetical protein